MRENPFFVLGRWWWADENNLTHGPYAHQGDALYALLDHCAPKPWWERLAHRITVFLRDENDLYKSRMP